ncbi:MAG: cation transporter, partial [Clostridia bacterium]|nr:cation transporter [Clostridia bacterium]
KNALVPEGGKKLLGGAEEKTTEGLSERKGEIMNKTLKIEGMMCPHCEAHVKEALEKIDGVMQAAASHVEGKVTVTLSKDVDDGVLAAAIESAGYKVK